ncbi:MAG TPA: hypothetical protein VHI71_11400 [Actinomycetota bacterium]|nr:hypothetical protein [Actinomycetota bacterium]
MSARGSSPPPPPPPARRGRPPDSALEDVAAGQRMLILAIVVNVVAGVLRGAVGDNWAVIGPVVLVAAGVAIGALLRLTHALGFSEWKKVALVLLAFVPLVNLVMLAMVNERATKALRAGGYEVGLLGARRGRTV